MRKRSTPEPIRRGFGLWSLKRATGVGIVAGLAAIVCWVGYNSFSQTFFGPWVACLVVCLFCGLTVLWLTFVDVMTNPRRGVRIKPLRSFDVAVGVMLTLPSLYALSGFLEGTP